MDPIEARTRAFYEWECVGRGWFQFPHRVPIEPPFRPFDGPAWRVPEVLVDDGRQPTAFSRFFDKLRGGQAEAAQAPAPPSSEWQAPPPVDAAVDLDERVLLIPGDSRIDNQVMDAWFRGVIPAQNSVAFELVGTGRVVTVRLACGREDAGVVFGQLSALVPSISFDHEEPLADLIKLQEGSQVAALEYGLGREFMIPLRERRSPPDVLGPFVGALAQARAGELALVQVLFKAARRPWHESILRSVTTPDGEPFFADAPQVTDLAREKVASPLFSAVVRLAAFAPSDDRCWQLVQAIWSGFAQWTSIDRNQLVPLASESVDVLVEDIAERATHRSGMLLSTTELASLVRFPGEALASAALKRERPVEVVAPAVIRSDSGVVLGQVEHQGEVIEARLPDAARLSHVHVIGASGTGKSTLLQSLILQDITAGHGVGVLDPHGDLVDGVLARLPEERAKDVILFDPADPEYVVGWNILGARSEVEKELLASDLVAVFRRLSTSWGDQMTTVLGNAVLAFLESSQGGTLQDLRRFLLDDKFRASFLKTVGDDHVASFWRQEFPLLVGKKPQAPILTRLDTFLRSRLVRDVVTERERPLDFRRLIDNGQVFLARLSQGTIGDENAALLGALLVSKFHQVALSRQDQAEAARRPFFLYIDEFQQVATPSMSSVFSGVRKYRLGLTVAHQDLYQLHQNVPEVERAILANAYTRIVFRVADEDARKLERGLGGFTASDLANLGTGQAVGRVGKSEDSFRLATLPLAEVTPDVAADRQARVREQAMQAHGRLRSAVQERAQETIAEAEQVVPPAAPPRVETPPPSPPAPEEEQIEERPPAEPQPKAKPIKSPEPGRGGPAHKYLQSLIKQWGEAQGFKAEVEKTIDGGKHIDVALSRDSLLIAVEIAMTTTLDWEMGNIEKAIAAGYSEVVVVSLEAAFLRKLGKALDERLAADVRSRVRTLSPPELFALLETLTPSERTSRVAGYKVKVRSKHEQAAATEARKKVVAEVLLKSLNRLRRG